MTTTETKTRTITLTGRAPVKINDAQWPVLAEAGGDAYVGTDSAIRTQLRQRSEIDTYTLKVRQHADGRALVYGVMDAAYGSTGYRGGELLTRTDDIATAIRRVGESCKLPEHIIRECIADLPAEEI